MPTLEERVAFLEGRVAEHARGVDGIRDALLHLDERMDRRFQGMDNALLHLEERIDRRFQAVEGRFDILDRRVNGLDEKMSRYFVWLVGAQLTTLAAIVAALVSRP